MLVVGDGVAATVLDDLDIVHLHAPDTELLVDVLFDHRSGLCGHIHRTVIAAAVNSRLMSMNFMLLPSCLSGLTLLK